MSIKDILVKLEGIEGLADAIGEEGLAALKEFDDSATESALAKVQAELKGSEGKAAGILEEKKKVQAKADELAKKIEEIESSGLSDGEKLAAELEKAQKAQQDAEAKIAELTGQLGTTKREHVLGRLGATIKWMDTVPEDARRNAVESAFKDVEDLTDEAKTKEVLEKLREDYKGLIQADEVPGGMGGGTKPKQSKSSTDKPPDKQTLEERAAHLAQKQKERR